MGERIQGSLKQNEREGGQQAAIHYFEGGTPQQVFMKTLDLLWTQAQGIFGEDAPQVICDAVRSEDPMAHVEKYLPSTSTTPTAA